MINKEIAQIFYRIADFLDADEVAFKPFAYRKAAQALEELEGDVAEIYERGGSKAIEEIPGIGESTGGKIEEFIKKGKISYYEELKNRLPVNWEEITGVAGVGPKKAKILYQELGVKNLEDLEVAARSHKISGLPGFGEKSEANIIQGIEFRKRSRGRFLLGEILPQALAVKKQMESLGILEKVEIAGSLRRRKETIGDVDLLAASDDKKNNVQAMDFFTGLPEVEKVWGNGETKSSVRMIDGFNIDLRIVPVASYGAALQYFTGSKEHNIALRRRAQELGYKLSEYGLFRGGKAVVGKSEEDVYEKLGLQWIAPELRENTGEIQAAAGGKLPNLVGYGDLKGDLHCHSNYSDGKNTIKELAQAAIDMGYEYIGIADHTKFLKVAHGLDEAAIKSRNHKINELNAGFRSRGIDFTILKGCEANILDDGSIDIDEATLKELDFVIAGIHSNFHFDREKMTCRIIAAMENPDVDMISHLTGRLLNGMRGSKAREAYDIDAEKIFETAKKTGTILEINSNSRRLDLDDGHIRRALDYGIKMIINTDAHYTGDLQFAELGISQARRGWAEMADIINTCRLDGLKGLLKK
ncbi:MAG: DNA polymerase/3'-5' exonuclease PolX [Candidatus Paceibacterota bacterium]